MRSETAPESGVATDASARSGTPVRQALALLRSAAYPIAITWYAVLPG